MMLIYCKEHRTLTSHRSIDASKWCCEVATLKQENERRRELLIQREMIWSGYTRRVCEKGIDTLLAVEEQE